MTNIIEHDRLYKNETLSDVTFVLDDRAGNSVEIPAHRLILASRSPVFERMFYGDLKEGHTVNITDVSAEGFTEFLQLFYLTKINLSTGNIGEVLKLVDKYDARGCWSPCIAFMEKTLDKSTAYEYYELSLSYDMLSEIKNTALRILCENYKLVLDTMDVKSNLEILANILKSNFLWDTEVGIFNAVMAWAEALLRQRGDRITVKSIVNTLGNLLQCIRFPVMSIEELLNCFERYPDLLPSAQIIDIISYVVTKKPLTVASQFNCKKRIYSTILLCVSDPKTTKNQ